MSHIVAYGFTPGFATARFSVRMPPSSNAIFFYLLLVPVMPLTRASANVAKCFTCTEPTVIRLPGCRGFGRCTDDVGDVRRSTPNNGWTGHFEVGLEYTNFLPSAHYIFRTRLAHIAS